MANNDDNKRGLASADPETRHRVAKAGGEARADDPDIKSGETGRKGGETTKAKYGEGFYHEIGKKGGQARADDSDVKSGELGRKGAAARWGQDEEF